MIKSFKLLFFTSLYSLSHLFLNAQSTIASFEVALPQITFNDVFCANPYAPIFYFESKERYHFKVLSGNFTLLESYTTPELDVAHTQIISSSYVDNSLYVYSFNKKERSISVLTSKNNFRPTVVVEVKKESQILEYLEYPEGIYIVLISENRKSLTISTLKKDQIISTIEYNPIDPEFFFRVLKEKPFQPFQHTDAYSISNIAASFSESLKNSVSNKKITLYNGTIIFEMEKGATTLLYFFSPNEESSFVEEYPFTKLPPQAKLKSANSYFYKGKLHKLCYLKNKSFHLETTDIKTASSYSIVLNESNIIAEKSGLMRLENSINYSEPSVKVLPKFKKFIRELDYNSLGIHVEQWNNSSLLLTMGSFSINHVQNNNTFSSSPFGFGGSVGFNDPFMTPMMGMGMGQNMINERAVVFDRIVDENTLEIIKRKIPKNYDLLTKAFESRYLKQQEVATSIRFTLFTKQFLGYFSISEDKFIIVEFQ